MNEQDTDGSKPATKPRRKGPPRRTALKTGAQIAGGLATILFVGTGFRLWQTGAGGNLDGGAAFDPWRVWDAGAPKDASGIITAAILAPSPHNTQPWRFTVTDNVIDLHADASRSLGPLDPLRREQMIGLGGAVENMVIGAQALGFTPILNVLPSGPENDHIARITIFAGNRAIPPEAAALAKRHTHRGAYLRERAVGDDLLDVMSAQADKSTSRLVWIGADTSAGKKFAQGTIDATLAIVTDTELERASARWMRHDLKTVNEKRDGIATLNAGLSPVTTRLALTLPAGMVAARQHAEWIRLTRDVQIPSAPLFGLLTAPSVDDRAALIECGRLWQRIHLTATLKGLAMQPLNQMMEMADRDRAMKRPSPAADALTEIGGYPDGLVVFGFRAGFAEKPALPSPRRGIPDVLKS